MLAEVRSGTEKISPLTTFTINFVDRQKLKMLEDKILNLVIIFESLYSTLSKLKHQCKSHCLEKHCMDCICSSTIDEFEEQMHEAQVNLKKADVLHKRAQGTAQLVETPCFIWSDALYNSNNSCPSCLIMRMRRSHKSMKNPLTIWQKKRKMKIAR
jgi:hypothetical protein